MALLNKNTSNSDDEEDLESLRLAALQSLKLKTNNIIDSKPTETHSGPQYGYKPSFGAAQTTRNHNRGFRNNSGRPGRNGILPRVRTNTNLISIQTIDDSDTKICNKVVNDVPKLTLPQDRYCKVVSNTNDLKKDVVKSNKFDRYNNSDDSESEVEEIPKETNLERSNSLEQLMNALENEINGVGNESSGVEETVKDGQENIDKKDDLLGKENENGEDDTLIILESKPDLELEKIVLDDDESDVEVVKVEEKKPECLKPSERPRYSPERRVIKSRSKSPVPYLSPRRSRSPSWKIRYPRELSPLTLNAEIGHTITMAPLSPRTAAFVLENRKIVAQRRRSVSRGSSRSITPKRSKISPRRRSRSRSLSPRRRTKSRSPKRKSNSPRNQHRTLNYKSNRLPARHSRSPPLKLPVHKRLGSRPTSRTNTPQPDERKPETKRRRASRSWSLSLSPSPDRNYIKKPLNESTGHLNTDAKKPRERNRRESPKPRLTPKREEKPLDPVLEARKRKFESGQIETNGIIKLKPAKQNNEETENKNKTSESEEKSDNIEDELDVIELNPSIDDLWSDEESNSENEGRFKSKPTSGRTITTLPFTKLLNKPNPGNIQLPKEDTQHNHRKVRKPRNHTRRRTSRSPFRKSEKSSKPLETTPAFKQINNKLEDTKKTIIDKEEPKKIKLVEVDDQNTENMKVSKVPESEKDLPRRVRIAKITEAAKPSKGEEKSNIIEEVSIHNDDDSTVIKNDDGDLRAELSRRRAERLKAGCLSDAVPTRLLKNALEDAVPKRLNSTKQIKGNGSSADRRVLVLKRLVASSASDLDPANKAISAPDGKLPIHMRLGLSSSSEVTTDENVRIERRTKRSRSGRRRKGTAVQV